MTKALKRAPTTARAAVKIPAFALPELAKGEAYAGVLLSEDGAPAHHLVLLPAKSKDLTWEEAKAWATKQGGELPTRREQSLLMANAKQHIEGRWHWSCEQHAAGSDRAWMQYFSDGDQRYSYKDYRDLARAVRRVSIQ